jgi:hypothetical protein
VTDALVKSAFFERKQKPLARYRAFVQRGSGEPILEELNGADLSKEREFYREACSRFWPPQLFVCQRAASSCCRIIVIELDCSQPLGIERYSLGHTPHDKF